jgi:hypothetical protein
MDALFVRSGRIEVLVVDHIERPAED